VTAQLLEVRMKSVQPGGSDLLVMELRPERKRQIGRLLFADADVELLPVVTATKQRDRVRT
jgi:hypothetical protein